MQINSGSPTNGAQQKKLKPAGVSPVKKRVIDPQVALYQELDFKVAINSVTLDKKSVVRRKASQNYLSWNDPYDLDKLLDEKYWKHKRSKFVYREEELAQLCIQNKKDMAGTF